MNVFQITADIPGKGEIPILTSPSLEELASRLSGASGRSSGMSRGFGTAFLIPYPNRIRKSVPRMELRSVRSGTGISSRFLRIRIPSMLRRRLRSRVL